MQFTSKEQYNSFTVFMTHTFPGGPVIKNSPVNAGDKGLIPGQEDSTCCTATKTVPNY